MRAITYPILFKGIQLREKIPGSPSYSVTAAEHSHAVREFYTPWSTHPAFAKELMQNIVGHSAVTTSPGGTKYITREMPFFHPNFPDYYVASRVSIIGDVATGRDENGVAAYDEAILQIHFDVPQYHVLSDGIMLTLGGLLTPVIDESSLERFVEIDFQTGGKFQTLPALAALKWDGSGGEPVTNAEAVLLSEGDLYVTWKAVPLQAVPHAAIASTMGKCNVAAFGVHNPVINTMISSVGVAARTLIMNSPRMKKPWKQANGVMATDITYSFRWKPYGANSFYFWNAPGAPGAPVNGFTGPGFYPASRNGAGTNPLYPTADFSLLFKPPQ